jgi:hypothetical protein
LTDQNSVLILIKNNSRIYTMLKSYLLLPALILLGLIIASCNSDTNNPVTTPSTGSIYVTSSPAGAQIWVDGTNSTKVTPDSITDLTAGTHSLVLVLANYKSDTSSVNVTAGVQTTVPLRTLVSDKSITTYGPIQVFETIGTTASQPSGIILKSGRAYSISTGTGKDSVDIYYSSTGFVVKTSTSSINNRTTSFLVGTSTNLNDGVASPLATSSWANQVVDTERKYFFLFDSDSHYSKMVILSQGGGTPGNPAYVMVQWLYNNKPNDTRF